MSTPKQRHTSSRTKKSRSHHALKLKSIVKNTAGAFHVPHRAAPGATEYNGHPIHVKGLNKALDKLAGKKSKSTRDSDPRIKTVKAEKVTKPNAKTGEKPKTTKSSKKTAK